MIPAQVFCRTVRVVSEVDRAGTGFLFDHSEGLALVTANHLTAGDPEELITFQQAWGNADPVTDYLDVIGRDAENDVVAFSLPESLWPQWFVGSVPMLSDGLFYGQDCYLLGYPYGLATRIGVAGNQIPIIRKGIISGSLSDGGLQQAWYVDAQVNPGFSGGPLVFGVDGNSRQYRVAGIIRGELRAPASEATADNPAPARVPAGLAQCTDAKFVHRLGLKNRD